MHIEKKPSHIFVARFALLFDPLEQNKKAAYKKEENRKSNGKNKSLCIWYSS